MASGIVRLRRRKNRPHKPLAVMARNLEAAEKICNISEVEASILTGSRKPIVLLNKKQPECLPEIIAPDNNRLGIMLPYAPLQFLLFPEGVDYLVMTSGNVSGSPICYQDSDALESLGDIADYFLTHNREIILPVDDAVVKVVHSCEMLVRCGRGYAPVCLPLDCPYPLLAVGAEQKSAVCVVDGHYATISQYLGDLENHKTYAVFLRQIEHFNTLYGFTPEHIAHDYNPAYLSSGFAQQRAVKSLPIQHHHAHMAGCMAENHLTAPAIGIICDGTGLGTDNAVWGGEFFVGTSAGVERVGHLKYVTLQGAQSAVLEPWRCAACYLSSLGAIPFIYLPKVNASALNIALLALNSDINCYQSASMGRLFDCVAALCGFQCTISFDAQAAIWLESIADKQTNDVYRYHITESVDGIILDYEELLRGIIADLNQLTAVSVIAARFHHTLIAALTDCVDQIHVRTGLKTVVLSGGVFENSMLLEGLTAHLEQAGFFVYFNRLTPTNDGGIAFGQAAAAGAILKERAYVSCYSGKNHQD